MRRAILLLILIVLLSIAATACGPSPKTQATEFAERLPERVGLFRLDDRATIELTAEAVGNTGHITRKYELPNVAQVYIVIDVYGTGAAANVAWARRQRDLQLLGAVFTSDNQLRYKAYPAAQVADLPGGRLAILRNDKVVIEVQYLPAEAGTAIPDASWTPFLQAVRDAGESLR